MRRLATRILVFGLVGAGISYGVAWGCAFWMGQPTYSCSGRGTGFRPDSSSGLLTISGITKGIRTFGITRMLQTEVPHGDWQEIFNPVRKAVDWEGQEPSSLHIYSVELFGRGWPCDSHVAVVVTFVQDAAEEANRFPETGDSFRTQTWDGWPIPAWLRQHQPQHVDMYYLDCLPVRPIFPGFHINAALYGGLAWLLVFMPGALRRRHRRRRGRCVRCNYDLRGHRGHLSTMCPECGDSSHVRAQKSSEETCTATHPPILRISDE